ncbi:hypothetical protein Cgig2_009737 [Carnegiea gigantea]|uniref:Uncharacterized protein n=1 Tax=Carnegiea gigantea TaxID=171969 RepID=A0A9Q1K0D8_9CARY|nr:hypothetical protein Cgig2_009737 [Carnegiea gigantea]
MSSSKRFEKTFSRKKKESNKSDEREQGLEEEEEQVLSTLAAKSRKFKASKNHTSNGETPETAKQPKASKIHTNNGEKPETAKKGGERPSKKTTSKQKIENVGTSSQNQSKQKKQSPEKQQTQEHKRKVEHGKGETKREEVKKKKKEEENSTPTKKNTKNQKEGKEDEESFECTFATNRIVRIIKSEGSDYRLSAEAVFLINKATIGISGYSVELTDLDSNTDR